MAPVLYGALLGITGALIGVLGTAVASARQARVDRRARTLESWESWRQDVERRLGDLGEGDSRARGR